MNLIKMTVTLAALTFSASAFAGAPMVVNNDAMGFQLIQYPQGPVETSFCDANGTCLNFKSTKLPESNTVTYKEVTGKCELTIETFDKSFATGSTKNEYMLDLMVFVVKVTSGEDKCVLQQNVPKQARSLTGIYQ